MFFALLSSCTALSLSRGVAEIAPLKAAMLMRQWQGLLVEVDQKVGVVPELGATSIGVKRFGPELERRKRCGREFQKFYEATYGLATADKSEHPASKRELLEGLLEIDGARRGPRCAVYASLRAPATLSLVERLETEWSVLALTMNPTERSTDTIIATELAALTELRGLAEAAGASLRVFAGAEETLCGEAGQLGLSLPEEGTAQWFRCS
mmetsp:Transcript_64820/g.172872  ORF Transcript_64820/g.172872 Transcript_64820/m.172872 type:complete len:210 (+) Transcript_64820:30-659(+)